MNISSQYVQILFYNFIIIFGIVFILYFLSNSSMFICCPVLLGNEWKKMYAKVWTISSWILLWGVWWVVIYVDVQILITHQNVGKVGWTRNGLWLGDPCKSNQNCVCRCWIRELQHHGKFSDLVVWPDDGA